MRVRKKTRSVSLFLILAVGSVLFSQTAPRPPASSPRTIPSSSPSPDETYASGKVVREIDDPRNGTRWLLMRNLRYPGGPGRLVPASEPRIADSENALQKVAQQQPVRAGMQLVVRAGDRLVVEENTALVDARLEGVALGPAAIGSSLNVRLAVGGNVVRALALAPGRAALAPGIEVQP